MMPRRSRCPRRCGSLPTRSRRPKKRARSSASSSSITTCAPATGSAGSSRAQSRSGSWSGISRSSEKGRRMASVMSFPTRILYGKGAIKELPNELKRAGATRPLLVTDKGILQAGLLRFVAPLLEQAGIKAPLFTDFAANPTDADALKGIEAYRAAGADSVLGVGGGASLDMAKAIALLVSHPPPLEQYDDAKGGDAEITGAVPPISQVPTTAGTGSEVGRRPVLVIDGTKTVIFSPALMAKAAILDP